MIDIKETADRLLAEADDMIDALVGWRRTFHQFPEIGMEEEVTATRVEEILSRMQGVEVRRFGLPTCVVARLGAHLPGSAVAFRCEMDAVEVTEDTGLPFSSYDIGVSHVQGHDAHMATMLGMISLLSSHPDLLTGPVVFIFQPGEEGKGGARLLIEAGILSEFGIARMICLHWMPSLEYGKIFTAIGGLTAFSSKLHIGLTGPGGHGGAPHLTNDTMFLSAQLQVALQALITREISPRKPAVISFGRIDAAEVYNVIPDETHMWGTVRSEDEATIDLLRSRIEEIVKGYARVAHIAASVEFMLNYRHVVNDASIVERVFGEADGAFGGGTVVRLASPLMVGEDFSYFSSVVPSCMMFLGTGMEYGLYHARYDIPEDLLPFASAWCAVLAIIFGGEA